MSAVQLAPGDHVTYQVWRWNGRHLELTDRRAVVVKVKGPRIRVVTDHDLGQRRTFPATALTKVAADA